jgi:hypothetical protein
VNRQFKFRGMGMWIFRSRGHNNDDGQNNKSDAFFGFGMWPTALDSRATSYHYGNCENKAFGGTTALATTAYAEAIIRLFAICRINTASTFWKTYQPPSPTQRFSLGAINSTPTPRSGQTKPLPTSGIYGLATLAHRHWST